MADKTERTDSGLLQQLAAAEAENRALRARLDAAEHGAEHPADAASGTAAAEAAPPRTARFWRAFVSGLLIVIAAILAPIAVVGASAHAQLTDTEVFVARYAPLAEDPEVQALVTDQLVAAIEREIDIPALTASLIDGIASLDVNDRAVAALRLFEAPINAGLSNLVRTTVTDLVESQAFINLWRSALRLTHSELVRTLAGEEGASLTIGRDGSLGVHLAPVLAEVKRALLAQGFSLAAQIPEVDVVVPIAADVDLRNAQLGYRAAVTGTAWLPWAAIALLATGVLVARNRRRAVLGAALGLTIGMGVLLTGFGATGVLLPAATELPSGAVGAVVTAVLDPISQIAVAVLTVAISLIVVSWFAGPGGLPTKLRGLAVSGAAAARGVAARHALTTGRFGVWVERWQQALRWGVALAAGLVVCLVRPLTTGVVVAALVGGLAVLLVIELVRRPEAAVD